MAYGPHVVLLGFRRRLHGAESSLICEGERIAGCRRRVWAGHYPARHASRSFMGSVPGARSALEVRARFAGPDAVCDDREVVAGPLLACDGGVALRLSEIVRRAPHLMRALCATRKVDAPDWLVAAGAIRDVVCDWLHGGPATAGPRDIDLGFVDPADFSAASGRAIESRLRAWVPDLQWDAKNQAGVHLWYPDVFGIEVVPFASYAESVSTLPENATRVGFRLLPDEDLLVVAPHGLDDLLGGICRHNPTRVSAAFYEQRLAARAWRARWPNLHCEHAGGE